MPPHTKISSEHFNRSASSIMTVIHQEITNSFRTVSMALTNIIRTRHRWLDRLKRTLISILAIDCLISSKKKRRTHCTLLPSTYRLLTLRRVLCVGFVINKTSDNYLLDFNAVYFFLSNSSTVIDLHRKFMAFRNSQNKDTN